MQFVKSYLMYPYKLYDIDSVDIFLYIENIYVNIIYTSITFVYTEFLHATAAPTLLSCIYCSIRTFFYPLIFYAFLE